MLSTILLSTVLLATSALSATIPSAPTDILAFALHRNIDINGPIPADATPTDGGWSFEADSDAAIWVRAQSHPSALSKRAPSGLQIGLWTSEACTGTGLFIDNVVYDHQNVGLESRTYAAVQFIGRQMLPTERLNLASRRDGDLCAVSLGSIQNIQESCVTNVGITCFQLTEA